MKGGVEVSNREYRQNISAATVSSMQRSLIDFIITFRQRCFSRAVFPFYDFALENRILSGAAMLFIHSDRW